MFEFRTIQNPSTWKVTYADIKREVERQDLLARGCNEADARAFAKATAGGDMKEVADAIVLRLESHAIILWGTIEPTGNTFKVKVVRFEYVHGAGVRFQETHEVYGNQLVNWDTAALLKK